MPDRIETVRTTVRHLQPGDVLTGSGQRVEAAEPPRGRVRTLRLSRLRAGPPPVRTERAATWRNDTTVTVRRAARDTGGDPCPNYPAGVPCDCLSCGVAHEREREAAEELRRDAAGADS